MKLRIPTRRHLQDEEEEHAEQQVLAVRRPAEAQVEVAAQRLVPLDPEEERRVAAVPLLRVRQVPVKVGPVVRLQVREVARKLRLLTLVPLSFLQCDSKSTKARSVKSKPSSTGRANSSSVPLASSQRRIMIGKVFFRPHSAARANT
jgi:hypothetical protein